MPTCHPGHPTQEEDVALSAMTVTFDIHSKGKWGTTPTIALVSASAAASRQAARTSLASPAAALRCKRVPNSSALWLAALDRLSAR
jgi:hypothetical protein